MSKNANKSYVSTSFNWNTEIKKNTQTIENTQFLMLRFLQIIFEYSDLVDNK